MKFLASAFALLISTHVYASDTSERCFKLSTGKEFCEPFVVNRAAELAVFGHGNAEMIAAEIAPFGLKPIEDRDGAIVAIDTINYVATNIGSYTEFILMYAVQTANENYYYGSVESFLTNSLNISNDPQDPHFGYYMKKLIIDGSSEIADLVVQIGKEGYGFPKEIGTASLDLDSSSRTKYADVEGDDWSIETSLVTLLGDIFQASVRLDQYEVSTGTGKAVWTLARKVSRVTRPMEMNFPGNHVHIRADGEMGDYFKRLNFVEERWLYSPSFSMTLRSAGSYWKSEQLSPLSQ